MIIKDGKKKEFSFLNQLGHIVKLYFLPIPPDDLNVKGVYASGANP